MEKSAENSAVVMSSDIELNAKTKRDSNIRLYHFNLYNSDVHMGTEIRRIVLYIPKGKTNSIDVNTMIVAVTLIVYVFLLVLGDEKESKNNKKV